MGHQGSGGGDKAVDEHGTAMKCPGQDASGDPADLKTADFCQYIQTIFAVRFIYLDPATDGCLFFAPFIFILNNGDISHRLSFTKLFSGEPQKGLGGYGKGLGRT